MRKTIFVGLVSMLLPAALFAQGQTPAPAQPAQAPAAAAQTPKETPAGASAPTGRVAVVDFQKAVFENVEGKKAQEKLMGEVNKRQKDFEEKQKALSEAQSKLQTQDKVLTDTAKADLSRQIDKLNTELQRMNDDAQKDLGDLQQQLLRPIADRTQKILQAYSLESGFSVVFDVSSQASSIVYVEPVADITTEVIRRVDAEMAKSPTPPAPAVPAPRPAAPAPAAPRR
jgi:Skp family chaperone for outer membrane proteins